MCSGLDDAGLQSLGVSDSSHRRLILDSRAHSGLEGDTESGQMSADLLSFIEDLDTITGVSPVEIYSCIPPGHKG